MRMDEFFRLSDSGLWLPDHLVSGDPPAWPWWVQGVATWSDVYGEPVTWDDVAKRLAAFGLGQVLAVLGGVSGILGSRSYPPHEGQRSIIRKLFRDPERVERDFQACCDRVREPGEADPWFFTEERVVAATKIALLECEHVPTKAVTSLEPIGEALVMTGDLIRKEESSLLPEPDLQPSASRDAWLAYIVKNALFNTPDDFGNALARSRRLYAAADGADGSMDLLARFKQVTGLDLDFAWAVGQSLLPNWRNPDPKFDRPPSPLRFETLGSSVNITETEVAALTDLFVVDAGAARKRLRKEGCQPGSLGVYDLNPIDRRPLVHLDGNLYCPSARLLGSKLTTGLHHVFLQGDPETDRFFQCLGSRFENYVEELFGRVFPAGSGRYLNEETIRSLLPKGKRRKGKRCDGVLLYGDTVVLLEYKATRFRYDVRARGDLTTLRSHIADIFGDAAEQCDDTMQGIENGHFREWVRPEHVRRYVPLVITLETMPIDPFFYEAIEEEVSSRNALTHSKMQPLQTLFVGELECLEDYMDEGGPLGSLLQERIDNGSYRITTMTNYLHEQGKGEILRSNRYLRQRREEDFRRTRELLRKRAGGSF